ncbi:ShlB/FhaC/HecB family hemolysin secretion/activation protein [Ruegeria sp. 2012CJ41-6]|uniref:ShlB/FhaC/HecB family hemolysin secretion/activation protein n=1 Tax=Ruegeria spongiae TaxID=2942209 RepID=A0ABT0Q1B3_9RHOB|nr:ShlB/FhaC/HecB family hemolysin secretion/activation protein [Ruegeria spongiae]MCL6282724.1 ShlB/FhaC/HecB family hemolysin secretion/activation protein [Ruegeria spongiae]
MATSLTAMMLSDAPVLAQSASNLAPSTFQPEALRPSSGPVTVARDPGASAPPGSENLFVTVGDVELQGALPQMAQANAAFRQSLIGQQVAVARIFSAVRRLESEYAEAGYVLARVVLPQQTLRDGGTLRIVVVDGFIESIDSARVPEPVRNRIVSLTNPLIGKRGIRLRDIERALLLAGDTYGVRLSSALKAGQADGGTVLVLDGEYKRLTGSYGFDNLLENNLGTVNLNAGLELNSALGLGETFYGRIGGAVQDFFSSDPRYRIFALGAVVPIGTEGMTFNIEGTASRANPDLDFAPTTSEFDRLSFRLYYPWIRSRQLNLTSQLILDRTNDKQNFTDEFGGGPIYNDKLSVLRATLDGSWRFENGAALQGGAVLSRGLDAFGARTASVDVPLSAQGASPEFTKLVVNARYDMGFNTNWVLGLSGRAQTSFGDPLVTSEQMSVAGTGEMSSFDAGTLQGDDGYVLRAEIGRQNRTTVGGFPLLVKPYLFGAYSQLGLEEPTFLEQSTTKASAYGVGVEILTLEDSSFSSGTLRLEFGRGERDDNGPEGNRFGIVASRRF